MDAFNQLFLATFITLVVLLLLVVVLRGAKRHLFPKEKEEERSEALTDLLLLQTRLQERVWKGTAREEGLEGPSGDRDRWSNGKLEPEP